MKQRRLCVLLLALAAPALAADPPALRIATIGDLTLESGERLREARIGYRSAGKASAARDNVVLFPTWFAGSSEDLFLSGASDLVDTEHFLLVAVDALGNGVSSSPSNAPEGSRFPELSIGDMVEAERRLVTQVLGVPRLHAVVGISMGGMQAFEWITAYPALVERAVPIVGSPRLGPYDGLLWSTELQAIESGRRSGTPPAETLELLGLIHRLAVRTPDYWERDPVAAAEIVRGARSTLASVNIANWEAQLRAMLRHDVGRRFGGSLEAAAAAVRARVLSVVASRDHMVTPGPALRFTALAGGRSLELPSDCGHVSFTCEAPAIRDAVRAFLAR